MQFESYELVSISKSLEAKLNALKKAVEILEPFGCAHLIGIYVTDCEALIRKVDEEAKNIYEEGEKFEKEEN